MRAQRTLAVACFVIGTCITVSAAQANDRTPRDARKQDRVAAQPGAGRADAARPAQPPRQAVKVVTPSQAPRPAAAPQRAAAVPRPVPPAPREAAAPSAGFTQPVAFVVPQAAAQDAMARSFGQGTPILPVSITSGLSCVPFARLATGMDVSGNGRDWWHNAAGRYARGQQPERGSVLAFRASGGMVHGHVAVVSRVVNDRTILIDHANWAGPGIRRGTVMRNVVVVDVSDRNDWTAVRVQVGHDAGAFGRTYGTFGFIYNRPAGPRVLTAEAPRPAQLAEDVSPHALRHMRLATQAFAD